MTRPIEISPPYRQHQGQQNILFQVDVKAAGPIPTLARHLGKFRIKLRDSDALKTKGKASHRLQLEVAETPNISADERLNVAFDALAEIGQATEVSRKRQS